MKYRREESLLLRKLEKDLISILRENEAYICGGAITSIFSNNKINDYDIYVETQENFYRVKKELDSLNEYKLTFSTKNALTYSTPNKNIVQLIQTFRGTPEEIFKHFDYTCCMGAYSFETREFTFHKDFFHHLSQKRLSFNERTAYPLASLIRCRKYLKRGYSIDAINMVKLALSIHRLNLSNYGVLRDQLIGVDISLFKSFLDKLEEKKEEPFEFEEFVEWLDNIFEDIES